MLGGKKLKPENIPRQPKTMFFVLDGVSTRFENHQSKPTALDLKSYLADQFDVSFDCFFVSCGSRVFRDEDIISGLPPFAIVVKSKDVGGKGGFGSLLRGGQSGFIDKSFTNNNTACRDLEGRRIRHVSRLVFIPNLSLIPF
jgi:hypothetical protein